MWKLNELIHVDPQDSGAQGGRTILWGSGLELTPDEVSAALGRGRQCRTGIMQPAAYSGQMMANPQEGRGTEPDFRVFCPF